MKRWFAWWVMAGVLVAAPAAGQSEYLIGGGDTLQVNVWKNPELSQSVVVRPDGQITLPLIRDVKAEGLTAVALGKVLAERFASFVNAPNVTVMVSAPTSFRVYTQGAIANGMYTLSAPITARQLLARAGGATAEAELSRAYLMRGDARIPLDLTTPGRGPKGNGVNPLLVPGDILAIPAREEVKLERVLVVGEVAQPQALPFVAGMTLLDAYIGAGGGTAAADLKGVKIARQQGSADKTEIAVDVGELLRRGALDRNVALSPGDIVIVPFRQPEERILVVGEVKTPKTLAYREGLTVLDAYVEAGGGTDFADLDAVKVVRAGVDGKKSEQSVDLERILKRADLTRNIALAPGDVVMVPR